MWFNLFALFVAIVVIVISIGLLTVLGYIIYFILLWIYDAIGKIKINYERRKSNKG